METTPAAAEAVEKIAFLQKFQDYLLGLDLSPSFTDVIMFVAACAILFLMICLLETVGKLIVNKIVRKTVKHTATLWDDFLYQRRFFVQAVRLVSASVIAGTINAVFRGYGQNLLSLADLILYIYITFISVQVISTFLFAVNDVYETKPQAQRKSIKGYLQVGRIAVYIVGVILVVSKFIGKSPADILVALGASAAVLSLVFKDTILGVVASIQISSQDMLRPGDWIRMDSQAANGIVTDINVSVVKVQNWDNTITMIPIYLLVSQGFVNWRYMQESGGRRIQRPLLLDIKSIKTLTPEMVQEVMNNPLVAPMAKKVLATMAEWNTSDFATNIGLYRCYVESYLRQNPRVLGNTQLTVRYLPINENGIPLEIIAFASETALTEYERIIADIFEHIIAVAPVFSVEIYQRPKST